MNRFRWTGCLALLAVSFSAWVFAGNEMNDALKRKPNLRHGKALYEVCANCHHTDGSGNAKTGVPGIAGQHYEVVLRQLVDFRDTERLDIRMEAFSSQHYLHGSQDLADVAAYISQLPTKNTSDFGPGQHTAAGKKAYDRACAECHGASGEGNARLRYARLAGQHYGYLLKQIDSMVGGSRFNVSWDHAQLLTGLTDEEMVGVADYLSRLPSPANKPTQTD